MLEVTWQAVGTAACSWSLRIQKKHKQRTTAASVKRLFCRASARRLSIVCRVYLGWVKSTTAPAEHVFERTEMYNVGFLRLAGVPRHRETPVASSVSCRWQGNVTTKLGDPESRRHLGILSEPPDEPTQTEHRLCSQPRSIPTEQSIRLRNNIYQPGEAVLSRLPCVNDRSGSTNIGACMSPDAATFTPYLHYMQGLSHGHSCRSRSAGISCTTYA